MFLAAYRQAALSLDDFEGPRFHRAEQLKRLLASGQVDAKLRRRDTERRVT